MRATAAAFGWLPAILWIAIGNPLFGAVHDFMSLSSSMRHEGKSIGYIIGEDVGERGKACCCGSPFSRSSS